MRENLQRMERLLALMVGKALFVNQSQLDLPGGWMKNFVMEINTNDDQQSNQI